MTLVGCFAVPHPPIIVPEVGRSRVGPVQRTIEAMRRLGEEAAALDPHTIVLLSPHAPLAATAMGVGTAESYAGSLSLFGAPEVAVQLAGDPALGSAILDGTRGSGVPAGPLPVRGATLELDHGTLVPLAFIVPALARAPRFVLLTFSFLGPAEHVVFGQAIGAAIDASEERVLYVASGDLSHRLTPDAPAGYSPHGREFDELVVAAFEAGDARALLGIPSGLQDAAGECGYRSLVVLFGLLEGRTTQTRLLSYEGPFGVGYMVGAVDVVPVGADPVGTTTGGLP